MTFNDEDIIVVEGLHDEIKIKEVYPNAKCVITNGSSVDKKTLEYIKKLSLNHNIIVFTDPDYPGERIRNIVLNEVPNAKQAFIRKKDAISSNKRKVGVEHACKDVIIESLKEVYKYHNENKNNLNMNDLFDLKLIGDENSSRLRSEISNILNIGNPNAKTFLKRLNLIGINKKELEDILCKIK